MDDIRGAIRAAFCPDTRNGLPLDMDSLAHDYAAGKFSAAAPPCLSLYQATHRSHPENRQDPIRFRNLVKAMEASLRKKYTNRDVEPLLEPYRSLAADRNFWNHTLDGLAVLGAAGMFHVYRLQRPVGELAVAADSFHVKPLIRILQSADRYQVLGLSRKAIRLFDGNRDVLDEVELEATMPRTIADALGTEVKESHARVWTHGSGSSTAAVRSGQASRADSIDKDTERYFRAVDRAVLEHHSRPSGASLLLAALTEHHSLFRQVSHNGFLLDDGLDTHPDAMSAEELRERAWRAVEPHYLTRLAGLVEMYGMAQSKELGTGDLAAAAYNAVAGRIATLLLDADHHVPGRIDTATGDIEFDALADPETDDLLDDLGELVMRNGGQVVVVPAERMPTQTGIAAIYRY